MSLGTLGRVAIEFGANLAGFESDMGRANRIAQKESARISEALNGAVKAVAASAAVAAGVVTLAVKKAIDRAAELDDLSQRVGAGVRELSQLSFGAQLEGVDDFSGALTKLSKSLIEAKNGNSQAAKAFAELGVSTTDSQGRLRSTDKILLDVAQSFSTTEDSADKTAIALELFGKSGADLIPFLNKGREGLAGYADLADRLGITISEKTAKAADDFNDQLFIGQAAIEGLSNRLTEALLPSLSDLTTKFVDYTTDAASAETVTNTLREAVEALAIGAAVVGENIFGLAKTARTLAGSFESVFADLQLLGVIAQINAQSGLLGFAFEKNRKAVAEALENRNKVAAEANARYVDLFTDNNNAVSDALREAFDTSVFRGVDASLIAEVGRDIEKALKAAGDEADRAKKKLNFGDVIAPGKGLAKAIEDPARRLKELNASLTEQIAVFGLSDSAALKYRLTLGDLAKDVAAADAASKSGFAGSDLADSIVVLASIQEGYDAIAKSIANAQQNAQQFAQSVIDSAKVDTGKMADAIRRAGEQGGFGAARRIDTGIADAIAAENARSDATRKRLQDEFDQGLTDRQTYNEAIQAAEREHQQKLKEIEAAGQEAKRSLNQKAFDALSNLGDDFQASVLAQSKKGFEISKAISIAQATVKTSESAIGAFNALVGIPIVGPALAAAAAATAITFGLAQIAAIEATSFQGRRLGGTVKPGSIYEVAEDGPELLRTGNRTLLLTGKDSGTVVPAKAAAAYSAANDSEGGRGIRVEINNAPPGTTAEATRDLIETVVSITLGRVVGDLRDGNGPASRALAARTGVRTAPIPRS